MSVKLPNLLQTYLNAANAGDADSGSACFAVDATVLDEGKTLNGRKNIREWMQETKKKYNHHTVPLNFRESGGEAIMTAQLTGTFPGSPITLEYHFKLKDNLIADLRVA